MVIQKTQMKTVSLIQMRLTVLWWLKKKCASSFFNYILKSLYCFTHKFIPNSIEPFDNKIYSRDLRTKTFHILRQKIVG